LTNNYDVNSASKSSRRLGKFLKGKNQPGVSMDLNKPLLQTYSFTHLKTIIHSIEWEITDQIMAGLIAENNKLKEIYRNDKILYSFLKLQGSIGKYISSKKATALPDSIKLLHSVYGGLEKVAQSPKMSDAEKKRILSAEVNKFKALKEQIILAKKGVSERMNIKSSEKTRPVTPTEEIRAPSPEAADIPEKTVAREDQKVSSAIPVQKSAAEDNAIKKDFELPGLALKKSPLPEMGSMIHPNEMIAFVLEEIKKIIKAEFTVLKEELKMWKKE